MSKVQPRTLSGFMELLPARQAQFDRMVGDSPPHLLPVRLHPPGHPPHRGQRGSAAKGGGETEKQIYRFMKGDTDLSPAL